MSDPTPEEITRGTDLVFYEISMFVTAFYVPGIIKQAGVTNEAYVAAGCLLLEARLLHGRNLIEFFMNRDRNNVWAKDYDFNEPLRLKQGIVTRLHQELSHLSRQRPPESQDWHYDDLDRPIVEIAVRFTEHLIKNRTAFGKKHPVEDWRKLLQTMRSLVPQPVTHTSSTPILTIYPVR